MEGIIDDLKKKYPRVDVDGISEWDPSPTKKYLRWMVKQVVAGASIEDVAPSISFFHQNNGRFPKKDINAYSDIKELEDVVKSLGQSKTKLKEETKANAVKLYDEGNVLLVRPDDRQSIQAYGSGTRWCITMATATYYETYVMNGAIFYFIIDNNRDAKDPLHKIALAYMRGLKSNKGNMGLQIFNANDHVLKPNEFLEQVPNGKLLMDITKKDATKAPKPMIWKLNSNTETTVEDAKKYWITTTGTEATMENHVISKMLSHMTYRNQQAIASIDDDVAQLMKSQKRQHFTSTFSKPWVNDVSNFERLDDGDLFIPMSDEATKNLVNIESATTGEQDSITFFDSTTKKFLRGNVQSPFIGLNGNKYIIKSNTPKKD